MLKLTGVSLANTSAANVNGGGTLAAIGSSGNSIAGLVTVAGSTVSSGQGTIDLTLDGAFNTLLTLNGGLTLGGSSAGQVAQLSFDLNPASTAADLISTTLLTGNAGGTKVNIGSTSLNNGTYTLVNYTSESGLSVGSNLTVGTHPTQLGTSYTLNLTNTVGGPGSLTLTVLGTAVPNLAYWTGLRGGSFNWGDNDGVSATNWATNSAGTTDAAQIVGSNTDVVFAADNASAPSLTTNLESAYAINSLTIRGSATDVTNSTPVVIGGASAL